MVASHVEATPVAEIVPTTSTPEHKPTLWKYVSSCTGKFNYKTKSPRTGEGRDRPGVGRAQINAASQLLESKRMQRDTEHMKRILARFEQEERKRERAMKQEQKPLLEEASAGLEFAGMSEVKAKETKEK
ncbi:hypothetical protein VNI00_017920, partial [Paramarasmius palmivorus]